MGDAVASYMTKGRMVAVEGRLRQRRWVGGQRIEVVARTVEFLSDGRNRQQARDDRDEDLDETTAQVYEISGVSAGRSDEGEEPF